jgi:hypothetical protein
MCCLLQSTQKRKILKSSEFRPKLQTIIRLISVYLSRRFTEDSLFFKGIGLPENKHHEVTINFYKKINSEKVASKNCGRCYEFIIPKADSTSDYWPSLTTDKKKPHWLKVDFNKWKDEGSDDDSDGGMGGMGGMPGMGGGMPGMGMPGNSSSFDI